MDVHLKPEIETRLAACAEALGIGIDEYLEALIERELAIELTISTGAQSGSGMLEENGLRVYRTGKPLPITVIDDAIRRARDERSLGILGRRV